MQEAACPLLPFDVSRIHEYLCWLVAHAISASYEDKAGDIRAAAAKEIADRRASGVTKHVSARGSVLVSDIASAAIRELASALLLPEDALAMPPLQLLCRVHRVVRLRVLPVIAADDASYQSEVGPKSSTMKDDGSAMSSGIDCPLKPASRRPIAKPRCPAADELLDLLTFPLGFTTHDSTADHAAAIMRMLYVLDLRELQDAVNDLLVSVQEFTANPKTDASLGQVGR